MPGIYRTVHPLGSQWQAMLKARLTTETPLQPERAVERPVYRRGPLALVDQPTAPPTLEPPAELVELDRAPATARAGEQRPASAQGARQPDQGEALEITAGQDYRDVAHLFRAARAWIDPKQHPAS